MSRQITAQCTIQVDNTSPANHLAIRQGEVLQPATLFYRLRQEWLEGPEEHALPVQPQSLLRNLGDRPWLKSTLEYAGSLPGITSLKVYYDGDEALEVSLIRGEGEVGYKGEMQEEVDKSIHFNGDHVMKVDCQTPPILVHATPFFDLLGQPVAPPVYLQMAGHGIYLANQPVFGTLVVTLSRSYKLYQFYYLPKGEELVLHQDGELEWMGGALPAAMVMARTRYAAAICTVPRSVVVVDRTMQWYEQTRQRSRVKVELSRQGVIDRVFPTPPQSNRPPLPDPLTGRSDYLDVERVVHVTFRREYTDYKGRTYQEIYQENFANPAPANSYPLGSYSRSSNNS